MHGRLGLIFIIFELRWKVATKQTCQKEGPQRDSYFSLAQEDCIMRSEEAWALSPIYFNSSRKWKKQKSLWGLMELQPCSPLSDLPHLLYWRMTNILWDDICQHGPTYHDCNSYVKKHHTKWLELCPLPTHQDPCIGTAVKPRLGLVYMAFFLLGWNLGSST